jgi:hypothetical protein
VIDRLNPRDTRAAFASITRACVNRGNLIIEHAARRALGVDRYAVEIDAHQPMTDTDVTAINQCDVLVLPGATLLQPGDHPALETLERVTVPTIAFSAALRSQEDRPDLRIARLCHRPIGSRDPFTHRALQAAGIESALVGCPTLLLGAAEDWQRRDGPIVFSAGLGHQATLGACARACAAAGPVVLLLHAPARQTAETLGLAERELPEHPLTDAEDALALIATAAVVVTSRIHALLAALVAGTPCVFLGPWYDSRYSLVEQLAVPIEPPVPRRIHQLVTRLKNGDLPSTRPLEKAHELRQALRRWLRDTAGPLGLPGPIPRPTAEASRQAVR